MAEPDGLDRPSRSLTAFRIVAGVLGVLPALLVVAFAVGSMASGDPEQTCIGSTTPAAGCRR